MQALRKHIFGLAKVIDYNAWIESSQIKLVGPQIYQACIILRKAHHKPQVSNDILFNLVLKYCDTFVIEIKRTVARVPNSTTVDLESAVWIY